jgi:CubicO group peptidase (beta-lactamase class C family)
VRIDVPRRLGHLTARAREVADLRALGLTRDGVEEVWRAVEDLYRTGLHPAIALCVRREGQVVLDRALGHARGGGPADSPDAPRVACTPDTPFCLFSASKAITALVVHDLEARGLVRLDDRVADHVPEFARHGKDATTLRHVITHRAGIPSLPFARAEQVDLSDWDGMIAALCDARPETTPGRRLAYHAITGGYILGEVVRRVTGQTIRDHLRRTVLDPLGFRGMGYGVAPDEVHRVASSHLTGRPPVRPFSTIVQRALGVSLGQAVEVSNDPRWLTGIVPAGNIVATANEASRFYQLLLQEGELDGRRVLDARTVRNARRQSSLFELDLTLGVPLRHGHGFMLGTPVVGLFGPNAERAFGHAGFIHIVTWADPARGVAAALLTSGKPFLGLHLRRVWGVLSAIARRCPPL